MPYVNCPKCSVRSFALAPWSNVAHCPLCDTPLTVRRQSMDADEEAGLRNWPAGAAPEDDATTSSTLEAG